MSSRHLCSLILEAEVQDQGAGVQWSVLPHSDVYLSSSLGGWDQQSPSDLFNKGPDSIVGSKLII